MSVLIKGMEMPPQGEFKHIRIYDDGDVTVEVDTGKEVYEAVIAHAVQIPPHGRLIDADALIDAGWQLSRDNIFTGKYEIALLSSVPTIIEAKGRETDEDQT